MEWICALPTEMTAAVGILDERYNSLRQNSYDHNTYIFDYIGMYNIIIAYFLTEMKETISAAKIIN
jgi:hypothetical protein